MPDQPTPRESLHDPCEAERHTDSTVLSLMFNDTSSWPWSVEELSPTTTPPATPSPASPSTAWCTGSATSSSRRELPDVRPN